MSKVDKKSNPNFVKVFIRQRPSTKDEIDRRRPNIIKKISSDGVTINSGTVQKTYTFEHVFDGNASQEDVYEVVVFPLIDLVLTGYTCTVFAYGQTGTGKTYTLLGKEVAPNIDYFNDPSVGLVPRTAINLFSQLRKESLEYAVKVSFIEIYNEEIRDLLISDGTRLRIYDDPENKGSTCIKGVTESIVTSPEEVFQLLLHGTAIRQTASTNLNKHSSRSHTIFTLIVYRSEIVELEEVVRTGKINLIDLAGSENVGKSGATEFRAREAGTINKSLLTLGKVIKALSSKSQHIPYRESKLTRVLQDSLGGKNTTCMIATFSPCGDSFDVTVSTLDYASDTRGIVNAPTVNINKNQINVLRATQIEVSRLREELNAARGGDGFYMTSASYEQMTKDIKEKNERVLSLLESVSQNEEFLRQKKQEYDQLHQCFEDSRSAIENVSEELQKESVKGKNIENEINAVKRKLVKLNKDAHELLNVCETSTKHEQIYFKKYDSQCNFALNNADVVKRIDLAAVNSLNELQTSSHTQLNSQKSHLIEIARRVDIVNENQTINLKNLVQNMSKINEKSQNCNLTFDGLFKDLSKTAIQNKFIQLLSATCQSLLLASENTKASINEHIDEQLSLLERETRKCKKLISREFGVLNKQFEELGGELHNLQTNSEVQRIERRLAYISRNCQHNKQLLEWTELEFQEKPESMETTRNALEQIKQEATEDCIQPLKDIQDLTGHYDANSFLVSCDESVKTNLKDIAIEFKTQTELCESKGMEYLQTIKATMMDKLDEHTNENKNLLIGWANNLNDISHNSRQIVEKNMGPADRHLENILAAQDIHCADLEQFIQSSSERLENLVNGITVQDHVGDTPVKTVYKIPRLRE